MAKKPGSNPKGEFAFFNESFVDELAHAAPVQVDEEIVREGRHREHVSEIEEQLQPSGAPRVVAA